MEVKILVQGTIMEKQQQRHKIIKNKSRSSSKSSSSSRMELDDESKFESPMNSFHWKSLYHSNDNDDTLLHSPEELLEYFRSEINNKEKVIARVALK